MTVDRVTTLNGTRLMLANLQSNLGRLQDIQDKLSSGKQIKRPSDDPAQVLSSLSIRSSLAQADQQDRNISDAQGWLNNADTALTSSVTSIQRVRDLALQAANGASDPQARFAAAQEIRTLRDGLLQLANTTYLNRPLFNGTSGNATAYDTNGVYQGDSGTVNRGVAPGVSVQVNEVGPNIFGTYNGATPYSGNLFQVVNQLATDVQNGNSAGMTAGLTALDSTTSVIEQTQVTLGARAKRVDDVKSQNDATTITLKSNLSDAEDIDVPKTIIDLQAQQMTYQAALAATAKVIQPSLLDFLK
jgi:flagellar hook-associated protein 3 FlgL